MDKIKELAIEAGIIVAEHNGFDRNILFPKEIKFAQLIIEECISACATQWLSKTMSAEDLINERFGIE